MVKKPPVNAEDIKKKKKNQILRMTKGTAMNQELRDPKTTLGH